MTTDPDDPVIIATVTTAAGESAGPLLTGGCHRLYKAAVTGREHLPSLALRPHDRNHPLPPSARARRTPDRFPGRSRTGRDCP